MFGSGCSRWIAERGLPPELIPGEAAQALWFLLHRPAVFQEVFFHEEILEAESWHGARAEPGLDLSDHADRRPRFEQELRRFFRVCAGTGQFCASRSYRFADPDCTVFVGYVSDRLRFLEAFTDAGEHHRQRVRTAAQVCFAYYPGEGTLLLKSRYRAPAKVLTLLGAFARSVLGSAPEPSGLGVRYDLDRLKSRFDPPLPPEVAQVRVKALELAYPPAEGRRRVRLETNARDARFAILELLREHAGSAERLARLRVVQADLQVVLAWRGRARSQVIRLWPDRCSLNQTPTAERLRRCLASWELAGAPRP